MAMDWANEGAPHGAVVTADAQTDGRGRRGRSWSSPAGKGLYLSLILRPQIQPAQVPQLTILAALAAVQLVEKECGLVAQTKWPNDILLNSHKIGGVLTEADLSGNGVKFVVVGIGLNVNFQTADLPDHPIFPASSLLIETGRGWPVPEVGQAWLREFGLLYAIYDKSGWNSLRDDFQSRCLGLGEPVTVTTENEKYYGIASRLDDDGILIVQTSNGPRRVVAGDVSFDVH
ncbi:MAG: biotin--[acetyl-CoA-carboxylase] ligase [Abitibacteriaceae bacterium]|nr:biotin--[acetyl-CoA-carboxylase] ligase [Abditibacteriaceae bacterium]MBV9864405.1 biotin--[acetyl-CoA-carboxylase] ligase [Abditibacteriaceae bacterium]